MSNAFNLSQLANNTNSSGQVALGTGVSGTLPIANGGTNNASLAVTAGGVLYTDGSKVVNVGAGTSGQVLTSAGASAPTWATAGGGSGPTGISGNVYTTTGSTTFTIPTGVTAIKITCYGAGGGGAYNGTAGTGGTSSVSSGTQTITTVSATGGGGAIYNTNTPGAGGSYSNMSLGVNGNSGAYDSCNATLGGFNQTGYLTNLYGYGGSSGQGGGSSGGSGGYGFKYLTGLTAGNTLTVTVGAGGNGVGTGQAGRQGLVIIEY